MRYGRYQVIREIGRGAMAIVYLAHDPSIGREVAVKVLRPDKMANEEVYSRFLQEAKVIGHLSHPHIVAVYDVGQEEGKVYLAMEFLNGTPLSELVARGPLEFSLVVEIGVQIAEALEYAHEKGVVHRDIKPGNIVLEQGSEIKLTDFGVAHLDDPSRTVMTQAGEIMGTPAYMSPEQALGGNVDGRSDLFSLGVVLYELSTGRRPFGTEGRNYVSVIDEIIHVTPRDPAEVAALVPKELSRVIMKALQKDPDLRFHSAKELAEALRRCLGAASSQQAKEVQRRPVLWQRSPVAAISALAVAAGVSLFHFKPAPHPAGPVAANPAPAGPVARAVVVNPAPAKPAASSVAAKPAPARPVTPPAAANPAPAKAAVRPVAAKPAPTTPAAGAIAAKHGPARAGAAASGAAGLTSPPAESRQHPKEIREAVPQVPPATLPKFAFLKVRTLPSGAAVYVNDSFKGKTPISVKLGLGDYRIRLTHAGYRDVDTAIKLSRMKSYQLSQDLKPAR